MHEPGSVRARLDEGVLHAWKVYCALEAIIPYPETKHGERISKGKLVASSPAWHGQAAHLVLELHEHVRRLEAQMAQKLSGKIRLVRGASPENTRYSLEALPKLAQGFSENETLDIVIHLERWTRRGESVLGPEKAIHHLPRNPGEGEARCPYCTFQTMRWSPPKGVAFCINPTCVTDDGVAPRWSIEYEVVNSLLRFSWRLLGGEAA
jgi:hypothetical protein